MNGSQRQDLYKQAKYGLQRPAILIICFSCFWFSSPPQHSACHTDSALVMEHERLQGKVLFPGLQATDEMPHSIATSALVTGAQPRIDHNFGRIVMMTTLAVTVHTRCSRVNVAAAAICGPTIPRRGIEVVLQVVAASRKADTIRLPRVVDNGGPRYTRPIDGDQLVFSRIRFGRGDQDIALVNQRQDATGHAIAKFVVDQKGLAGHVGGANGDNGAKRRLPVTIGCVPFGQPRVDGSCVVVSTLTGTVGTGRAIVNMRPAPVGRSIANGRSKIGLHTTGPTGVGHLAVGGGRDKGRTAHAAGRKGGQVRTIRRMMGFDDDDDGNRHGRREVDQTQGFSWQKVSLHSTEFGGHGGSICQ
jgi:hypothetical protein